MKNGELEVEEDDENKGIYKRKHRTFLEDEEEIEKAKEETEECERCGAPHDHWAFNCGKDCIYHEPNEDGDTPCKCTNKNKAGFIETRNYCTFKKRERKDLDLEDIEILIVL
ncbi:MAG: hypothetical protein ACOC1X_03050 [Promethearchaeota archaeon]